MELHRIQPDTQRFFAAKQLNFPYAGHATKLVTDVSGKIVA